MDGCKSGYSLPSSVDAILESIINNGEDGIVSCCCQRNNTFLFFLFKTIFFIEKILPE